MESELGHEIVSISKEFTALHRDHTIQSMAQTQILCALLNVIDEAALQRLKKILEIQAASGELQGLAGEACKLSVQLVALATDREDANDPRKLFRVLPGGKKN